MSLCRVFGIGFLDLDVDEAIMVINYFIEKGEENPSTDGKGRSGKEERIKVNDKTATGGWY